MPNGFTFHHRVDQRIEVSSEIGAAFTEWRAGRECWLFLAAHDDDIICGGGLTFLTALAHGVETHALITTDGRMGYCRPEHRTTIAAVRSREARASFQALGLPLERLQQFVFPDCDLHPHRGRRFADADDPTAIEGARGLQNTFTYAFRKVRPTRVFLPTHTDLHPDHRIVNEEALISLFHAQGGIWPELGTPLAAFPRLYEYATYCDFSSPPQICIETPSALLETKLRGIRAYASQEQIETLVELQCSAGPVEYIHEMNFEFYSPEKHHRQFLGTR